MICLTGDVHHDSLATNESLFLKRQGQSGSELGFAREYVKLCERYRVRCTLYVTGATLAEQWDQFKPLAGSAIVEVGGHTYAGLPRSRWSRFSAFLTGSLSVSHGHSHGTPDQQRRDVRRMMEIARRRLGDDIVSWRSHGLVRDEHTYPILAEAGIKCVSDEINWQRILPERLPSGLVSHPLNVIMDHDHIYHAHRTREYVERQRQKWAFPDDPTSESFEIGQWGEIVERQVREIEIKGGLATVLMHPVCMGVTDGFRTLERLLRLFAQYKTVWAWEVAEMVP